MSGDDDRKLAELLARGAPPPVALDPERRRAVLAAATQGWFRRRAAKRRWLWAGAAAGIVAAFTTWMLETAGGEVSRPLQLSSAEQRRDAPPPAMAAATSAERDQAAPAAASAPMVAAAPGGREEAIAERNQVDGLAAEPMVATKERAATLKAAGGMRAMDAPAADAKAGQADLPEPQLIPADAPERGKLLAAAAIVHAARTHVLGPADRNAALQAAIDLIARIRHPAADDLRRRIAVEMRRR